MPSWADLIARQDSQKIYAADLTLKQSGGSSVTLRLCDHPIPPATAAYYYDPRLRGMPHFSQRLQEVFYGQSQRSHGYLEIINQDGGLDSYLTSWVWDGQEIALKLGFPELAMTGYEPVVTGRMGKPTWDDGIITVPVNCYQIDLLRATYTDAGTVDTVPNHVSALLTAAGIASIDATLWASWAAENNFNAYLESSGEAVSTLLDRLVAPLANWYAFNRAGAFIIGTFKAPTAGTPALSLGVDGFDLELLSYEVEQLKQYWKMTVQYISATAPVTYSSVTRQDAAIKTLNPNAEEGERQTLLTVQANAETVRDRWWGLHGVARTLTRAAAMVQPLALKLHDEAALSRTRYSLAVNYRLTGFNENHVDSQVAMELFK
jgi:hypothetical protein